MTSLAARSTHPSRLFWLLLLLGLSACATGRPEAMAVAGSYAGTVQIESEEIPARLELRQRGDRLEGSLRLVRRLEAQGDGEITGRGLTLGLAYDQGCAGQLVLTGRATPDGTRLEGSIRVADCTGTVGGRFSLRRAGAAGR
ncbi:MAG: hypothetical protein R3E98_11730 [Gemmatimonadota bacterium]